MMKLVLHRDIKQKIWSGHKAHDQNTYTSAQMKLATLMIELSDKAFMAKLYYQVQSSRLDKDNPFIVINVTSRLLAGERPNSNTVGLIPNLLIFLQIQGGDFSVIQNDHILFVIFIGAGREIQ